MERSILDWLNKGGIRAMPEDAARVSSDDTSSIVRVTVQTGEEEPAGMAAEGYHAARVPVQVLCQCWARGADSVSGAADAAAQLADTVATRLRLATVPILDWVGDPSGATTTGQKLQSTSYPTRRNLPPDENGWARRLVTAPFFWFLQIEEA